MARENTVTLVRHGETEWSRSGRHTGQRSDIPLTDHGRAEARQAGALLTGTEFALVLRSPMDRVRELGRLSGADIRKAKEVLAFEATKILHGKEAAGEAQEASRKLFGKGVVSDAVPTTELAGEELEAAILAPELFQRVGLCRSRSEARRLIQQGGAYVNDVAVGSVDDRIGSDRLEEAADGRRTLLLRIFPLSCCCLKARFLPRS